MPDETTVKIDVRWLPPPEPFERIMNALQTLPAGASLQVLIHREPHPLYETLHSSGYIWQASALGDDGFEILIHKA